VQAIARGKRLLLRRRLAVRLAGCCPSAEPIAVTPDLTGDPTSSLDNMQAHDSQIYKTLVGSGLHQLCTLNCMLQSMLTRLYDVWTLTIRPP
jgi:hypothetical protein